MESCAQRETLALQVLCICGLSTVLVSTVSTIYCIDIMDSCTHTTVVQCIRLVTATVWMMGTALWTVMVEIVMPTAMHWWQQRRRRRRRERLGTRKKIWKLITGGALFILTCERWMRSACYAHKLPELHDSYMAVERELWPKMVQRTPHMGCISHSFTPESYEGG